MNKNQICMVFSQQNINDKFLQQKDILNFYMHFYSINLGHK